MANSGLFVARRRIYIVYADDSNTARLLMKGYLAGMPYEIELAAVATPDEALKSLGERKPDLLITDLNFGRNSGEHLIRKIRTPNHPARAIPIILVSSRKEELARIAALDLADACLAKPLQSEELRQAIGKCLKRP